MGYETYHIPVNYTDAGKLFGLFEIRNVVEAVLIGLPVLALCARFLPLAERISRRFGYSTILYARSGYDAVCVERLDGWHPIQVFLNKTGDRRPLGMGSATLSILAAMPEDEAEMILTHNEQEIRFVLKTDFSALRGFLAEARRKGYASAQGMLLEGTIGVSHVLRMGNEAVGSIAIDAVRSEQWDKDQPKIIQELQSALS